MIRFYPEQDDVGLALDRESFITTEEADAYAERLHALLGLPKLPEREEELVSVGLDPAVRVCHESMPWTDPQRRVKLIWSGTDVPLDAGAAAYYAWVAVPRRAYPYAPKLPVSISTPGRKRLRVSVEAVESGDLAARAEDGLRLDAGTGDDLVQTRLDRKHAAPGTQWLRDNDTEPKPVERPVDFDFVFEDHMTRLGYAVADVIATFAKKGRPTDDATRVREDVLGVLVELCPDTLPITAAADLLGTHRVQLSKALSARRATNDHSPAVRR